MGRFDRNNKDFDDDEDPPIVPTTNLRPTRSAPPVASQPTTSAGSAPAGSAGIRNTGTNVQGASGYVPNMQGNVTAPPQDGMGSVQGTENVPTQTDPNAGKTNEELLQEALAELLGKGPRSTTEDEALINEMMQSQVGQDQADLNARMGAGGFGTSGALGSMSGDMHRMAARDAAGEIQGVRQGARDEWLDRVRTGMQGQQADRGLDITEQQWRDFIAMTNAANEPDPEVPLTENEQEQETQQAMLDDIMSDTSFNKMASIAKYGAEAVLRFLNGG